MATLRSQLFKKQFVQKKLKVLKSNEILFSIVGILSFDRLKKPFDQIIQKFSFYFNAICLGMWGVFSAVYIYGHFSGFSKLQDIIMAFMMVFGALATLGSFLSVASNKEKVEALDDELQEIVEEGSSKNFICIIQLLTPISFVCFFLQI